jgi:hypothetical protein
MQMHTDVIVLKRSFCVRIFLPISKKALPRGTISTAVQTKNIKDLTGIRKNLTVLSKLAESDGSAP